MDPASNNPQNDLIRIRTRLLDLQRSQRLNPETFALYQQTILQLHQETENRKQSCFAQAQTLRTQAAAIEAQGHAFSSMASILFSVVNGYVVLEERRLEEERAREQERQEALRETQASAPEPTPSTAPPPGRRRGRPRKVTPVADEGSNVSAAVSNSTGNTSD